jgi:hypothetical protein
MMDASPSDVAYRRLHRSGWSIGDTAFTGPSGRVWLVSGHNGENLIRAEGRTCNEAWESAIGQALEVGMVGADFVCSELRWVAEDEQEFPGLSARLVPVPQRNRVGRGAALPGTSIRVDDPARRGVGPEGRLIDPQEGLLPGLTVEALAPGEDSTSRVMDGQHEQGVVSRSVTSTAGRWGSVARRRAVRTRPVPGREEAGNERSV